MKILYLTCSRIDDINSRATVHTELMQEFIRQGHDVYIASPSERRFGKRTHIIESPNCHILKIRTFNIQKTNIIEKGIGTLLLESQFGNAIKRYWGNIQFNLILYSTPPITFNKVIARLKKSNNCHTYLLLKDIFPQNAVDLGMMKKGGFLHQMFRQKEEYLYSISDRIGCMSPANCEYLIKHNPKVNPEKVELCPNAIRPVNVSKLGPIEKANFLKELGLPTDKTIFIYGGNLGKPQGVDFLLSVINENEKSKYGHIIIIGDGTEYGRITTWFKDVNPINSTLMSRLPKEDYDKLIRAADVGLIFLDPRFTIPNFPSRLLSYLENKMPVLLATDENTDMGQIAMDEGFGLWSKSGDIKAFMANMKILTNPLVISDMGEKGNVFLLNNYTVDKAVKIILS